MTNFFLKYYGIFWVNTVMLIAFGPVIIGIILQHYTSWPTFVYAIIAVVGMPLAIIADVYMLNQRKKEPGWDAWNEI